MKRALKQFWYALKLFYAGIQRRDQYMVVVSLVNGNEEGWTEFEAALDKFLESYNKRIQKKQTGRVKK